VLSNKLVILKVNGATVIIKNLHREKLSGVCYASSPDQISNKSFEIRLIFETSESVDDFAIFHCNDSWNSLNLQQQNSATVTHSSVISSQLIN